MSKTHEQHLTGEQVKAAMALVTELADTDHALAAQAMGLLAEVEAAQFDRDPATWTAEPGQRHLRDGAGRIVPNRHFREVCAADPEVAAMLFTKIAGIPDDISELDDNPDE